jgi:4-diphosphocytidyl-2C-methyl-D-erythritol kinase
MLTSQNQEVENIIGYTNSEYTFSNFKNISGSRMCQSNIGNLISRLAKYDKAIYHLALSLQNVDSKKFFSNCLTDEFDESDSLLHKIEMNYKKNIKERNMNKLVKKQQRGKSKNFSQKII